MYVLKQLFKWFFIIGAIYTNIGISILATGLIMTILKKKQEESNPSSERILGST